MKDCQGKRPRHYADEIIRLPSRAARRAALLRAPPDMQPLIRAHVERYFMVYRGPCRE